MNDIYILVDTNTAKTNCENKKIGVLHANLQNKLIFEMTEKINGSAWLEYEIDGVKNYAVMEETEKGYQIDIKSCLLISDYVEVDLKITETENADGIPIFISTKEKLEVYSSINAIEEEPEYYPDWKTIADSKIAEMNQLKEDVNEAITKTNNLNIDVSKSGKTVTITLTKKDNTTKTVTLSDGTSLMFNWNGTKLGIKTDEEQEYTYVDLIGPQGIQGETGATPNLTIGTVITGNTSSATITGTPENPILNLVLEKGETGETGATGNGISSIEKTGMQDNVDTYTIYYTNGTTSTFTVTNSTVTNQEFEELKAEHEELVNTLPRVEGTGESITIDNTAQYNMNVALSGNTSQVQYTGKNLFNKANITTEKRLDQSGKITSAEGYFTSDFIAITANTQYTKNSPIIDAYHRVCFYTSNDQTTYISRVDNSNTFTTPENAAYLRFCGILTELDTTQLELGSTATSYEPYVGGMPSPNPLYPQPIKKVTGNNSIIVCGRNLVDFGVAEVTANTTYTFINNVLTVSCTLGCYKRTYYDVKNLIMSNLGKQITFSYESIDFSNYGGGYVAQISITYTDNTPITNLGLINSTGGILTATIPAELSNVDSIRLRIYCNNTSAQGAFSIKITKPMLIFKSAEGLPYEPYQSQTYPINLGSLEYCKIGNYSDEFYLDNGNWYKKKYINKKIIDGSANWILGNVQPTDTSLKAKTNAAVLNDRLVGTGLSCYTDYFIFSTISTKNVTSPCIKFNSNAVQIIIISTEQTVNAFKEWVNEHNITVYYILATPTSEAITDTTLIEQLNNLYNQIKSHKGQTNITQTNAELPFNIDASALYDLNNLISRVATLETEV